MQEQRKKIPGRANKTNNELQALCDPLLRKLDREEKDKYKQMKKAYKEKDRMENEERFSSLMHTALLCFKWRLLCLILQVLYIALR